MPEPRSTQFFAGVLDSIPAILWTADPATLRFTWVSRSAESILGFPVERWVDTPDFRRDRIHPDDRHVLAMYQSQRALDSGRELVYRMIAADGSVVWIRDQVHVCSSDDDPVELCGVMLDVTSEHEAHEALVRSEENYRRLVNASPDAIGVHTKGRFVFVNPKFVEIFGADHSSQLLGSEVLSLVHPAYREVVRNRQAQIAIGDDVPMTREKLVRIDGTPFDAEVMAIPVVFNGSRAVQVIARDVTQRIRTDERLQLLASVTNEAIWEGDYTTNELWTNDCYRKLFGSYSEFDIARRQWFERIHPDDRDRIRARMDRGGDRWSDEYRIRKASGDFIHVLDRGRRTLDADGRPLRVVGAILDVTPFR